MFNTREQLLNKIAECRKAFEAKNDPKTLKKSINICGGTGCMSAHSEEIKNRFEKLIEEAGIGNRVSVNFVGCFGFSYNSSPFKNRVFRDKGYCLTPSKGRCNST